MNSLVLEAPTKSNGAKQAPFRLVKSETLIVGREQALEQARAHQTLLRSPAERDLDPKWVEELVGRIKAGRWLPCSWATVIYEGVKSRMNGQHSSQAILDAGDGLPDQVVIHLDQYEAHEPEGMGLLFRQFDDRNSGRSKQDVAGVYQGLTKEALEGISRKKAKIGIEGIGWFNRVIEKVPVSSGDDLYKNMLREVFHPFIRWLENILSIKTPELERVPIVAAMYGTFIKSEAAAQDFWANVAKNNLSDDSDPRAVLSAELVKIREDKGKAKTPAPGEYYAKCIKAWRAFRMGEKIHSLSVNTKKGLPDIAP